MSMNKQGATYVTLPCSYCGPSGILYHKTHPLIHMMLYPVHI